MSFESFSNTIQFLLLKPNLRRLTLMAQSGSRESMSRITISNYPQKSPGNSPKNLALVGMLRSFRSQYDIFIKNEERNSSKQTENKDGTTADI